MEHNAPAKTNGIHHLGLTVPDIEQTASFFLNHLSFKKIGGNAQYPAIFISDGTVMLTLWQAKHPQKAAAFDRHNAVGLHHFALKVAGRDRLHALYQALSKLPEVHVEFAPENLGGGPTQHMMCYIPSGIRVEFIAIEEVKES